MDNSVPQQNPVPPPPVIVKKGNNAPLIGAIIFLALVIGASAIYLGLNRTSTTASTAPTPQPTTASQISSRPTPTPVPQVTLKEYKSEKMKDLSFPAYTISHPADWEEKSTKNDITDSLVLTKGTNEIKIYQAPMGGGGCIFEGDVPDGPYNDYKNNDFEDIVAGDISIRRIIPNSETGKVTYPFCSNGPQNKSAYFTPTYFGVITYTVTDPTNEILTEMDGIIATLKPL